MSAVGDRKSVHRRIRFRIRKKLSGTAARPRLAVFRSLRHIYVQAIDDATGKTLVSASSQDKELRGKLANGGNADAAKQVGELLGGRLKEAGVKAAVFDRGGFVYHGRVKALADAVRSVGVEF